MSNAMTLLALNLFSVVSLLASVFLILSDHWQWWLFLIIAVACAHGVEKKDVRCQVDERVNRLTEAGNELAHWLRGDMPTSVRRALEKWAKAKGQP